MRKMSIAVILAVLAAGPALASDKTDVMAPVHQFVDGFNKNDVKTAEASITIYDPSHQGRAPVWSPDGNYMAFESDRAGGYAVFLAKVKTGTTRRN
jgi:hypothetical protein